MPVSWRLALALGLALAVPTAAYALPTSHHHYKHPHDGTVVYRAVPPSPASAPAANLGFWPPSYTTSHQQYEIEGLTRNTDDCVKYGCLGAN